MTVYELKHVKAYKSIITLSRGNFSLYIRFVRFVLSFKIGGDVLMENKSTFGVPGEELS